MVNSVDKFLNEWGRWLFFCGHFVTCARCFQHHNLNNSLKLLKCFRQCTAVSTVAHTTCVHVFHCICHGHHQSFLSTYFVHVQVEYAVSDIWIATLLGCMYDLLHFCLTFLVIDAGLIRITYTHSLMFWSCTKQKKKKKDLPTLVLFQFLACTSISSKYVLITEYRTTSGGQGEIIGSVHSCCKTYWRPSLEIKVHSTASYSCDIVFIIYR